MKLLRIKNRSELNEACACNGCKAASSFQTLIKAVISRQPIMRIAIAQWLLPDSYIRNPYMLAKSIHIEGIFLRSYSRNGFLFVVSSYYPERGTFLGRVRKLIDEVGAARFPEEKVPLTYRRKPSIVSKVMREHTNLSVTYKRSKGLLRWFVK